MDNKLIFFIAAVLHLSAGQLECPNGENYYPCMCSYVDGGFIVECHQVYIQDVAAIFQRTGPSRLKSFIYYPSALDLSFVTIPENLLNQHYVFGEIQLRCPHDYYCNYRIHPNAFESSKNFTRQLLFDRSFMYWFDFSFLEGFSALSSLSFASVYELQYANWTTMPSFQRPLTLNITNSYEVNWWTDFPNNLTLENLYISGNNIMDPTPILNWTLTTSSNTLRRLHMSYNRLLSIPWQVSSFTKLDTLKVDSQYSGMISPAVNFTAPVKLFDASGNRIAYINPGAFNGDFAASQTDFNLFNNSLTRFEEFVFKSVLQQMVNVTTYPDNSTSIGIFGHLNASRNPFDCSEFSCHLNWLIKDNRHLLYALSAECSDGTDFSKLEPDAYYQRCHPSSSGTAGLIIPINAHRITGTMSFVFFMIVVERNLVL